MKLYRNTYANKYGVVGRAYFRTATAAQQDWEATSQELRHSPGCPAVFVQVPIHKDDMIAFLDELDRAPDIEDRRDE
jgi:hypothetical protein